MKTRKYILILTMIFAILPVNGYTTEINNSFIVGQYFNNIEKILPILFKSNDQSRSWVPASEISTQLPADFKEHGSLQSTHCSEDFCIAVGEYTAYSPMQNALYKPLLAVSTNQGSSWSYSLLQPDFFKTLLGTAHSTCYDHFCVISDSYKSTQDNRTLPLIAVSHDKGKYWIYPKTVISQLPADYVVSNINDIHCEKGSCIAVGSYNKENMNRHFPLIMMSHDEGLSWEYAADIHLPANSNSFLMSARCDSNFCSAVGLYNENDEKRYPLILYSTDQGKTWDYSKNPWTYQSKFIEHFLYSLNCEKGTCIASGYRAQADVPYMLPEPLLAMSYDHGMTWIAPPTIYTNLPPHSKEADMVFKASTCHDNVCMAAGQMWAGNMITLIAISHDQGKTWTYAKPISFAEVAGTDDVDVSIVSLNFKDKKWILTGFYGYSAKMIPFVATSENDGMNWKLSSFTFPADFISGYIIGSQHKQATKITQAKKFELMTILSK